MRTLLPLGALRLIGVAGSSQYRDEALSKLFKVEAENNIANNHMNRLDAITRPIFASSMHSLLCDVLTLSIPLMIRFMWATD